MRAQQDFIKKAQQRHPDDGRHVHATHWWNCPSRWTQHRLGGLERQRPRQLPSVELQCAGPVSAAVAVRGILRPALRRRAYRAGPEAKQPTRKHKLTQGKTSAALCLSTRTWGYQLRTMRTIISKMPTDRTGRSTAASVPAVFASISASSNAACSKLALHVPDADRFAASVVRLPWLVVHVKGACAGRVPSYCCYVIPIQLRGNSAQLRVTGPYQT